MSENNLIYFEIDEEQSEELKDFFRTFNSSLTIDQQLKIFRKISKIILNHESIPRALFEKFFTAKVKHPIKNAIQHAFKQIDDEIAMRIINEEIEKKIIKLGSSTVDDQYHFISCLNESSQIFKIVPRAISEKPEVVTNFLISSLINLFNELKADLSPSESSKIANRLHNTMQAFLSCIKLCVESTEKFALNTQFQIIADLCMKLLTRDEILIDTKNICGMLIVLKNNLCNESAHLDIIRDENEDCTKRLCLISGLTLVDTNNAEIGEELCTTLQRIYTQNSVDHQVVIAISRIFMQLSRKLQNDESTKIIINFTFSNIEHSVDLVRHHIKTTLKNILEVGNDKTSESIFESISSISTIEVQAIVVQSILSAKPIELILTKMPNILTDFLTSLHKCMENIFTCCEVLSCKYYDEVQSFEKWHEKIIQPIINEMNKNTEGKDDLKLLLSTCIKKDVRAIELILKNRDQYDVSFIVSCLKAAKKASLLDATLSTKEQWRGVITYDELKNCMISFDDNVRYSAFQLIAETKKATEEFNQEELECIFYFYKMNINIPNATIRQSIVGTTQKIFERLQSIIQVNRRKRDDKKLSENFQTLLKFQEFAIENLIEGANFSRRMLSLKLLSCALEVLRIHFDSEIYTLWSEEKFSAIFNVFYDNFESNKEAALEIMNFLPRDIVLMSSRLNLEFLERLATSIKTSDSLVAAYLLQFSIKFSLFELASESEILPSTYGMLIWCESLLQKALQIAQKSIIISGGSYTLYGPMLCIRYIVNKLNLKELASCQKWREYFHRLVKICKKLSDVVAPIVNSSSPEGVYPDEELQKLDDETFNVLENTTSQMILVNAWRTIKEISLFLGDLSIRGSGIILGTSEMLEIADHFLILMTKIKHRGAFEQAFHGYSQFCIAMRLSHEPELRAYPEKILQNLITSIAGDSSENENNLGLEMKNLCATRRSAGLPFILQSLITSEMKIITSHNFHLVMKNLLRYARFGSQLETRIHSMNILRTLFRCKDLNDGIMEYVSDGIECALLSYDAESWTERNSSTLLFSALMIRIFGPQRTKNNEELSMRNRMSGKVFFLRFPNLHNFFTELLRQAAEKVYQQKKNVKLHPLLLLLNRLYGSENSIKLTDFIPIVMSCSACVELQTRILCAKFVANNMPPKSVTILNDIKHCRDDRNLTANAKHGKLLRILYLSRREYVDEGESLRILNEVFETVEHFGGQIMCLDVLLEIMVEMFSKIQFSEELLVNLDKCLKFANQSEDTKSNPLLQKKIIALNLVKIKASGNTEWLLNLNCAFYELQEKLNCILLILDFDYALQVMDDYEIDAKICEMVRNVSSERIVKNSKLKKALNEFTKGADFCIAVRSYEILSYLEYENGECCVEDVKELLECSMSKPDDLAKAMMKYVTRCLNNEGINYIAHINWKFLEKSSESSYFIKLSTLDFLEILIKNISFISSLSTTFYITKAILNLLMDDDVDVRFKASKIISTITNKDQLFIASHAHEIFLEHLEKLSDKNDFMALIICLIHEDIGDYNRNENEEEFQVFERNETNLFKERFLIKQLCTPYLKANERDAEQIINACRVIGEKSHSEIENILKMNWSA